MRIENISTDLADGYELLRQSDIQAKKDFAKVIFKLSCALCVMLLVLWLLAF